MKKALIPGIVIILVVVAVSISLRETSSPLPTTSEIIPGVKTLTYHNAQYGFSLNYPEGSKISESGFEGYVPLTQSAAAALFLPQTLFAGTNLSEAGVIVGISEKVQIVSTCTKASNGGETAKGTVLIDGVVFNVFDAGDAGAGNFYESKIYRALHNNICYEIVALLHSGNIGNYEPGAVVEFDKQKFSLYLDAMVKSFSFSATAESGVMGTVTLGPTCPVEKNPPDPNCAPQNFETEISITNFSGSGTLATGKSGVNGRFRIALDPGKYDVYANTASREILPRCAPQTIEVKPESFIEITISCDTGIR